MRFSRTTWLIVFSSQRSVQQQADRQACTAVWSIWAQTRSGDVSVERTTTEFGCCRDSCRGEEKVGMRRLFFDELVIEDVKDDEDYIDNIVWFVRLVRYCETDQRRRTQSSCRMTDRRSPDCNFTTRFCADLNNGPDQKLNALHTFEHRHTSAALDSLLNHCIPIPDVLDSF